MDCREEDRYASDKNLRGTPCVSRKKPKAGRLCHGLEKDGMVRAWHGRGMGMAWKV